MALPATRIEIADLLEATLDGSAHGRDELISAARDAGARQRVLDTLSGLPDRQYLGLRELWPLLPEIQIGS